MKTRPKSPSGEQCALSAAKMAILYFVYYAAFETPSHLYRIDNNYKIFDRRRWKQSAFDYIRRRKFSTLSFPFFLSPIFDINGHKVKGRDIGDDRVFRTSSRVSFDLILKTSSFPLRLFSNRFCLKTDYYFRRNVIEIGIGIILRRSESEFFQTFVIITFISRFNLEN